MRVMMVVMSVVMNEGITNYEPYWRPGLYQSSTGSGHDEGKDAHWNGCACAARVSSKRLMILVSHRGRRAKSVVIVPT
jgi:hypothetical protein